MSFISENTTLGAAETEIKAPPFIILITPPLKATGTDTGDREVGYGLST